MPRTSLYFAAAFGVDGAVNLTLVGVPWKAIALGATPLELGLLPAVWSVVYILSAMAMGHLSDRAPRLMLSGFGAMVVAFGLVLLAVADTLVGMQIGLALQALGLAMFWPSLQASLAGAVEPARLPRNLGWFNLSWSSGKGIGFAAGGLLYALHGFGLIATISATITLAIGVLLFLAPRAQTAAGAGHGYPWPGPPMTTAPRIDPAKAAAFLAAAWVANGVAYGVVATLAYHYPKFLEAQGFRSAHFGFFLGGTYLSQTLMFALLMRTEKWHFRRGGLYLMHAALALVLLLLPRVHAPALQLALAPIIGACLGLAYYSSIYYSLHAAARPGRNTGRHEAIIGSGVLLAPPIGGWLATATGQLAAPYWLCAALSLLAIGGEQWLLGRRRSAT
ncbi:MAG TPA: MFS transporter [Candidatus Eisenbacteria bacterium]